MTRFCLRGIFTFILASIFTFTVSLFIAPEAKAYSCSQYNAAADCQEIGKKTVTYSGTSCISERKIYACPDQATANHVQCSVEGSLTCNTSASVCEYQSDGYSCGEKTANFSYCNSVIQGGGSIPVPPGPNNQNDFCGTYKDRNPYDLRPYCNDWWNACVNSCEGASGGRNYACSGFSVCQSNHSCATQAPSVQLYVDGSVGPLTYWLSSDDTVNLTWSSVRSQLCWWNNNRANTTTANSPSGGEDRTISPNADGTDSAYDFILTCENTAGPTESKVTVTVKKSTPTPTPTTAPGIIPIPTPTTAPGACNVNGVAANGNTGGSATVTYPLPSGRNAVKWMLNEVDKGSNSGPSANFSNLSPGTNYTVSTYVYDTSGSNSGIYCGCTAFGGCTFTTGGGPGGGGGRPLTPTPTPRVPVPTEPPLRGAGAIRFYNADCTTPYNGTDTLKVLTHAQNADGSFESSVNNPHNNLFYATGWTHNTGGVGRCESKEWHPYYDPGYLLNTDGTVGPCGGNMSGGSGYSWKCEEDGNWRNPDSCDDYNNDGSYAGTTECCNSGSLKWVLNGDTGQCISQDSYPNSGIPQCYPVNNSPTTVSAGSNRVSLTSTREMRRIFSVAGPTGTKLKVIEVCVDESTDQEGHAANRTCDWQGVENPSRNPNRGSVQKDFNSGTYPNYYASGWDYSHAGTGTYVYDVCVRGNTPTISGNVFLDKNGDGDKDTGEPGFGGGRVFVNGILYRADTNGNYTAADLELGGNHTVDIDPPADYRVTTGNDPTTFNNLRRDETVNFGITPIAQAWFQTMDADILALGTIISKIPMQCIVPACTPKLGLPGSGGYPGIPMFGGSNPNFGYGTVSEKRWLANSRYNGDIYNYAYFQRKMPANAIAISGNVNAGDINGSQRPYTWYYSSGDLNITSTVNYGRDEKVIIFVNGNLTIKSRITIDKGTGFFAAIVSGNINIDPGVSHPNQPALEGVYLADGIINTASPAQAGNDTRLYVRGNLVAPQGTINLSRNLDKSGSGTGNQTTPAEYIEYAPDLLLNFPPQLLRDNPVWEEVAP